MTKPTYFALVGIKTLSLQELLTCQAVQNGHSPTDWTNPLDLEPPPPSGSSQFLSLDMTELTDMAQKILLWLRHMWIKPKGQLILWQMLPQAYYEGDRDEPFIQSIWDSFLFSRSMGTPSLAKVQLDDLHTVFGPGVFPKPSAPVISPPSAPLAPEIMMGDPSQLNLPSATLAPEINMDDPYYWNSDEEEDEDD
ncbi:hypothetical protein BS47DRAFT_1359186 [Hydnum rufescens UP504]|uniref:Uncharacterized protein n=1 Tax=Hydnum rufescens UP504 TaxID=1448309 RepID=A0A9P6B7W3_9AGAM|nr:hypothetical protein BS47DRAFT_1359186 [Hydnum rufescens UP504]